MQHYSQLKQDIFALKTAKNKTYIEIGAAYPVKISNTYLLEMNGWKGFSIEINSNKASTWSENKERKNKLYVENAITFDYINALQENNLPKHIGFLSVDIEPPENTFSALKSVIEQGISFDCITFEHDKYQSNIDYDPIVKSYLKDYCYEVAVDNVFTMRKFRLESSQPKINKKCYLETWFVNKEIYKETIDYVDWLKANE